jgi:hypothetical protein
MAFIIDKLIKLTMLKIFGTTKPKFFTFGATSNDENESYFDPYFQCIFDKNGDVLLKPREIPDNIPIDLQDKIKNIKNTCYWMDESLFGLKTSNFMNKLFGAREIATVEREYVNENMKISTTTPTTIKTSTNDNNDDNNDNSNITLFKSRRLGIGISPILQILPFIGNYILFTMNLWILFCMFEVGFGYNLKFDKHDKFKFKYSKIKNSKRFLNFKSMSIMMFNIMIDFGIGFIPFLGMFVSIIHRSSSRNLAIFWKSMEEKYKLQD